MKLSLSGLLYCISISVFSQNLSIQNPPASATLFAEGFISTPLNERDFAISPEGNEIYYTISTPKSTFQTIVFLKKQTNGNWTKPEVAPFAGKFTDLEPAFSADGKTLYFASNRPVKGEEPKDFDIWKVTRTGSGWDEPVNLGTTVNTDTDEFYPSIAKSGNLYFTATYKEGPGREDIYVATLQNGIFQKPVPLDTAVNTKFYEFNAFVSPDEKFIIFTSYGRDDTGGGDLYISTKDNQGKWKPAQNLAMLNSKQLDYCPYVSPDGTTLFFTSDRHELPVSFLEEQATVKTLQQILESPLNGNGNIYWVDFKKILGTLK
jgi:Tol biopolymer transport system component